MSHSLKKKKEFSKDEVNCGKKSEKSRKIPKNPKKKFSVWTLLGSKNQKKILKSQKNSKNMGLKQKKKTFFIL